MQMVHMKSSDAKASKCHLKFSRMIIFIKLVYLISVISRKWQLLFKWNHRT